MKLRMHTEIFMQVNMVISVMANIKMNEKFYGEVYSDKNYMTAS